MKGLLSLNTFILKQRLRHICIVIRELKRCEVSCYNPENVRQIIYSDLRSLLFKQLFFFFFYLIILSLVLNCKVFNN